VRAEKIVDSLVDWSNGYLFASLNELCQSTAEDIVTNAQARGLAIGGHFTQTTAVARTCSTGSFGNMVMHPGQRLDVGETILAHDDSTEIRKLTCVSTSQPGQLRMCVTHVTDDMDFRNDQVRDVQRIVNPYASGSGFIAVGGDFNQTPATGNETLDMYSGYGGYFDDVDRSGSCNDAMFNQATLGTLKYDYDFVDHTRFSCYGGVVITSSVSDHRPLRGAAELNY
jgi:endonuclease/exonuclease/phosphatase family metal-dependent hydrolase